MALVDGEPWFEKRREKGLLNVYSEIICDLDEKLSHGANSELVYRRDCPTTPSELSTETENTDTTEKENEEQT